jgi:hypothetical protein
MFSGISGYARPIPNPGVMTLYHKAVDALAKAGITLIGMDSSFPSWLTGGPQGVQTYLPCRDLSWGSPYSDFLNRWEATWAATAREFPTIRQWEIGNETNQNLPPPFTDGAGACGKTEFTAHDRLLITLDLMYYGNRGVKSVDPDAVVYMPSISPNDADGNWDVTLKPVADFLEQTYAAIAAGEGPSTNPRDYFDGANWHPYIGADATHDTWLAANARAHWVLQVHGDGSIPVIFSEAGYTDANSDEARDGIDHSIDLAQREMPWLTYLIWFRAYATFKDDDPKTPDPEYALLVEYPFKRTKSAEVFCKYTGCDNPPYRRF